MDFRFKRITGDIPKSAQRETWLGDCRLLFLGNRPIGRAMTGRFSGTWGGVLYIDIKEDPDLLRQENGLSELEPDLYIEICNNAQVTEDLSLRLKPGVRDINEFLRVLQTKKVRGDRETEWQTRSNTIRRIREFSDWLDAGVYEIIVHDDRVPRQFETGEAIEHNEQIVRSSVFAAGGISETERKLFRDQMVQYRHHATRTRGVDRDAVEKTVRSFYQAMELEPPHVVVLPNPLATVIAGAFSAATLFREKNNIYGLGKLELLSKYVSQGISRTADRSSRNSIDTITGREISELIQNDFVASRFSEDTMRFLSHLEFPQFERSFVDPEWSIDFAGISDAINSVQRDPGKFVEVSANHPLNDVIDDLAKQLSHGDRYQKEILLMSLKPQTETLLESNIVPTASFCKNTLGLQLPIYERYALWEGLVLEAAAFVMHQEFCFVSDFPEYIEMDSQNRLHCPTGPAIRWRDGWSVYYWHGTPVPKRLIESPETITVAAINQVENQEYRRVMIDRYGVSRYLLDTDAREIHRDNFGVLYRQEVVFDEPIVMVRVTNSTPEPDGTFKEYFLRVPPTITTARAGVAWTFGFIPDDYNPAEES